MQTLERIQHLIAQVCMVERDTVVENARLLAFGIDSIRVFELLISIEEDFQIQLEPEKLMGIATVGELAEYIDGLRIEVNQDKED